MVAGERPSFASEKQNFACDVPMAMSHAATSPVPPANAGPCTRAMVGCGRRSSAASIGKVLVMAVLRHALHPVQVGAGAERRPVAGQDYNAHRRIVLDFKEGFLEQSDERVIERIAYVRPVERDAGNAVADIDVQHGSTRTSVFTELAMKHFSCAFSCRATCA